MAHLHILKNLLLLPSEVQEVAPDECLRIFSILSYVFADAFEAIELSEIIITLWQI
jgi:hypothetical protein